MKKTVIPELENNMEISRESVVTYLSHGVESVGGETFGVRICFALGDSAKENLHFEVVLMTMGENDIPVTEELSEKVDITCEAEKAELCVGNLPLAPRGDAFELLIHPYTMGAYGLRRYGVTTVLYYSGKKDTAGAPLLLTEREETYKVIATDDTFIFNEDNHHRTENFGKVEKLHVRNTGDVNTNLYRAAYFKFKLDTEAVKLLDEGLPVKLRLFVVGTEHNIARKYYNLMVYATDTAWTENELNYNNHRELAATRELLAKDIHCEGGYLNVDIREYLKKQTRNEDGTITVSFCVTNEGHEDAIVIFMSSKESDYGRPMIEFGSLAYNSIEFNLPQKANNGFEPWGYAKMLADEWFDDLVDKIYPKDENGNVLYYDDLKPLAPKGYRATEPEGDFTCEMKWIPSSCWVEDGRQISFKDSHKEKYIRTIKTLGSASGEPFTESKYAENPAERDIYGGVSNAGFKGKATGFFHTEKHGKRTYIIDPLGNPYFAVGINTVCLGDSENHKRYSLEKYETAENYYKEISASLKDIGFTINHLGDVNKLLKQENGLACVVGLRVIRAYMEKIGRATVCEGVYPHNNTINVFDPDFIRSAHEDIGRVIDAGGYANMSNLFGYTTDNEQPAGPDILDRYLLLDPTEPTNAFSYATAWTWLARRMKRAVPTLAEFQSSPEHAKMNSEFLSFMYGRYSKVSRDAIHAFDPNHMYIGSRVYHTCLTDEGYLRAAGYYLDIITANLYGNANPRPEIITNLYRYSGKPFIVTEFYAKAADSMDANGFKLANSCGAGQLVETQQNRADYYEHYALTLLESGACVGWTWYRYRDNDQGLFRKKGTDNTMYMCHVTYGTKKHANTFMDENGKILTASEVGEFEEIYHGEPMASNQNVNKGIYTCKFNSMVTVYNYDKDGNLIDSMGYEVEKPESETPAEGTVLRALSGDATYTIGSVKNADGGETKTILTVYEGKYLAFAKSVRAISDYVVGLAKYFDEQ